MGQKFLLWGIIGLLTAGLAATVWRAMEPAKVDSHRLRPPNLSQIPQDAPIVAVKMPAQLSSDAQLGQKFFEAKCAACHGTDAGGRNGKGPPLIHPYYEPNHHADIAVSFAVKNGVRAHHWPFGNMPPVTGLTDGDVKLITTFIREVQRNNGIK